MSRTAIALLFLFVSLSACGEVTASPVELSEAEFSFSTDPTEVVLSVHYGGGLSRSFREMKLYGDGRLELSRGHGPSLLEQRELVLEFEQARALLQAAVTHGLAEWDEDRIRARQMELTGGRTFNAPTDHPTATILVSLESYERGALEVADLDRTIRCYAPYFVDQHYPKIVEIRGIVELLDRMNDYWTKLEGES